MFSTILDKAELFSKVFLSVTFPPAVYKRFGWFPLSPTLKLSDF